MVVSSSVCLVIHPMAAGLSVFAPHPVACHAVFLFPAAVYQMSLPLARRAFRPVPSRRELPLQVACFLIAALVSGPLAFTRGGNRARARAVPAACAETAAPLTLYGRFAARDPPCHKQECVYYFWRDRRCYEVTSEQRQCFLFRVSHSALDQGM